MTIFQALKAARSGKTVRMKQDDPNRVFRFMHVVDKPHMVFCVLEENRWAGFPIDVEMLRADWEEA